MKVWMNRRVLLVLLASMFMLLLTIQPVAGAENHDELFVLIGDSLMKAKAGDQTAIEKNMEQFTREWKAIKKADSKQAKMVDQELNAVKRLLAKNKVENVTLLKNLSSLSSEVVRYDEEQNPQDKAKEKEQVKQLIPLINNMKDSIEKGERAGLSTQYQALLKQWTASEQGVHDESITSYGNIEKYMALIRIAITQDPPDPKKAILHLDELRAEVENLIAGNISKKAQENYTLSDLSDLLNNAEKQISQKNNQKASNHLNEVLTIWPMVEGDVQTRDSKLYSDMETKIPTAISILNSKNVSAQKASEIIKELNSRLSPLMSKTDYTLWDAALILLREGLEALFIVATLLAFLKKMDQTSKQKWVWAGVVAGILASAILAIMINIVFSQIVAASSREYIEGITGVVAVVMMLTIGVWLHNQSSIGNWNKYINQQMEQAVARGSLLSFTFISFLSIFREGAETIIFYTGITPYISLQQLLIGVILALAILVVVGYLIINYSVKIPIRLFFRVATILIYVLAFKILGMSIHALQVSKVLSTNTLERFPFMDWMGIYPTLETTIPQLLLLVVIFAVTFLGRRKVNTRLINPNV